MAPNDEFIREVDDEYRRDRVAQMWKRYNGLIIGGVLVMLALVGGWRYWEHVQETRAQEAGARFEEALRLSRDEKSDEAKPVFEALAKEADGGYTLLARFRLAAELGQIQCRRRRDGLRRSRSRHEIVSALAGSRAATRRLAASRQRGAICGSPAA